MNRLTGWNIETINTINNIALIVDIILGTIILYLLTEKWLDRRKLNYMTTILWMPYFILFAYLFALQFPMLESGDRPNPATGLIVIVILFLYPIYILLINWISSYRNRK